MINAPQSLNPGRVAIIGLGSRAFMFLRGVVERPGAQVVALCDTNKIRAEAYNEELEKLSQPRAVYYGVDDFDKMLSTEKVETLVVTTMDSVHDIYIVKALDAGVRVLTEKPMTTTAEKCRGINDACRRNEAHLSVTFNYRFNPVHELVKRTIASGAIGRVNSVHFEWLLDTVHGADYFRRWHANKENSGGLMVHKSGHHFDLVNWWIDAAPSSVAAFGQLGFYGSENGKETGFRREYDRARGSKEAEEDPFAIHLEADPTLKKLYADAEGEDGYQRDRNVFQTGIDIEDDVSLIVKYNTGATMSYHLTAYSPWEGYNVVFNGTKGRLQLSVVESTHRTPFSPSVMGGQIHGTTSAPNPGGVKVTLQRLWEEPVDLPVEVDHAAHGGGDTRMLNVLFGPKEGEAGDQGDAAKQRADERDGTLALAVGLAANLSFKTGRTVSVKDLDLGL